MTSIQFHLRRSSLGHEFEGSVFIRIIHQRKSLTVTTPFRLYPSEWDEKHHCINYRPDIAGRSDASGIYEIAGVSQPEEISLSRLGARFHYMSEVEKGMMAERELLVSIVSALEEEGDFTVTDVIRLYRLRKSGVPMLAFVEKLADALVANGQYRTARAYRTVTQGLAHFAGKDRLVFTDIRSSLLKQFQADLLEKGKTLNTVSFYMRNLRAIYNRAVREYLLDVPKRNPFENVYTGIEITRKRALKKEDMVLLSRDLLSLKAKNNETPSVAPASYQGLLMAQRLFLFSFHARGMSFVDIAFLKKSDIHKNTLVYRRRKTGQQLEISVTPEMRDLIDSFREETKNSPYLFPIIQRPGKNEYRQYENGLKRQNRQLKRLGAFTQLTVQLSTHVARHTWASLAKQLNFPLAVISEGLGHASEKTTSIYLSSFDQEVLDKMNRSVSKAVKKVG